MNRTGHRYRTGLLIFLLVALFTLPFINQAFHIDDRLYLEVAEHALENPLFPYDYPLLFEGLPAPDGASHSHLPLTVYYMSLIMFLTGSRSAWVFHLFFMIFPLIAAFSFYDLARRYVSRPLLAVFLLLSAPVFMTLSHNLMTDIPMLAFWLLALSRCLKLLGGEGKVFDMVLAGVGLAGAAFLSLLTAGLVILLAAGIAVRWIPGIASGQDLRPGPMSYSSVRGQYSPPAWAWWAVLLVPVLIWAAWYGRAWFHYDRLVLVNTFMHMDQRNTFDLALIGTKLLSFILNIGGIFCFPILIWAGPKKRPGWIFAILAASASLAAPFIFLAEWNLPHKLLFSLFLSSGLILAAGAVRNALAFKAENLVLAFWFAGILLSCLLLFYSGSARYVLLALPPSIIVITRGIEDRLKHGYMPLPLCVFIIAGTLAYSLPISCADYEFAETYRDKAKELCAKYQGEGKKVWFTGEWGFRHYMAENGAAIIPRDSVEAAAGDIIIKPYLASPWVTLYDGNEYCRLVEQVPAGAGQPLRILDFSSHAGFYSSGWGLLPFSWTSGQHWEWFNVYEVTKEFRGPVPKGEAHW